MINSNNIDKFIDNTRTLIFGYVASSIYIFFALLSIKDVHLITATTFTIPIFDIQVNTYSFLVFVSFYLFLYYAVLEEHIKRIKEFRSTNTSDDYTMSSFAVIVYVNQSRSVLSNILKHTIIFFTFFEVIFCLFLILKTHNSYLIFCQLFLVILYSFIIIDYSFFYKNTTLFHHVKCTIGYISSRLQRLIGASFITLVFLGIVFTVLSYFPKVATTPLFSLEILNSKVVESNIGFKNEFFLILEKKNLKDIIIKNSYFQFSDLYDVNFQKSSLFNVNLSNSRFINCDLSGSTLYGVNMDDSYIYYDSGFIKHNKPFYGIEFSRQKSIRKACKTSLKQVYFENIDFTNLNLSGISFNGSRFKNVNFSNTALQYTDFSGCTFEGRIEGFNYLDLNAEADIAKYKDIRFTNKMIDQIVALIQTQDKNRFFYCQLLKESKNSNRINLNYELQNYCQ